MSVFEGLLAPTPYVPEKEPELSSMLVKWCRDPLGPPHDYFEVYRYTGFIEYLIVEDPKNLTEEDQETITERQIDFFGRPEDLFVPGADMYNYILRNCGLLGQTRNTYITDRSVLEEEYYTYIVAGIRESERTDGLSTYIPIGSEPNGWYRTLSYLYSCALNSLSAKDLYIMDGVWDDETWTTSEFCETSYGSFSYQPFEAPTDELGELYSGVLVP